VQLRGENDSLRSEIKNLTRQQWRLMLAVLQWPEGADSDSGSGSSGSSGSFASSGSGSLPPGPAQGQRGNASFFDDIRRYLRDMASEAPRSPRSPS
jgi:hypothetical protein